MDNDANLTVREAVAHLRFLSQALRQAPTGEMMTALLGQPATEAEAAEAARDFQHLLEGPEKPLCPPWESAWMSEDDLLFQRETLEVRSCYRRHGLAIAGAGREPEDHIAFELAFCAFLLDGLANAEDEEEARSLSADLRAFHEEHLRRWGVGWARSLAERAHTPYWRELAALLAEELTALEALLGSELGR
ncbi:molecular chaperone [Enterorhabdus sp. P55]|uniref:TorD/DmsD family molecular chaperone n=1 Tax=Enterorhabdus sp. P55 TaxID=2304571 RepID=UPI001370140B|nr:molecular chaperone TorD family protein [Enterorhabdus sp. P55]NBI32332.1 hypothetical protein [Enterorhabdus sp. P55]